MKILQYLMVIGFFCFCGWATGTLTYISTTPSELWTMPPEWFLIGVGLLLVFIGSWFLQTARAHSWITSIIAATNSPAFTATCLFLMGAAAVVTSSLIANDVRNQVSKPFSVLDTGLDVFFESVIACIIFAGGVVVIFHSLRRKNA